MLDAPSARLLLGRTRPIRHADGYPAEVRVSVLELVRHQLAAGTNLNAISRSLGVNRGTLRRWLDHPQSPGFIPIVVKTAEPLTVEPAPSSALFSLTSPSGFRLDGMNLDQAIYVLSRVF